jgi:hypothetical protein
MSGILQAVMRDFRSYGGLPMPIGTAYGGGFFAGQINVSGTKYNLVVAPKASGENNRVQFGTYGVSTGQTSVINGPTNRAVEAALGPQYQAATFCEDLTIGGFSDWYLPAKNELEVLYYYLKPTTNANDTSSGSNANAVSPEPISTSYSSGAPAQTGAGIGFRTGETDAFASVDYWTSTDANVNQGAKQSFVTGAQGNATKDTDQYARAVRRVAA